MKEILYSILILNKIGKEITKEAIQKILDSVGFKAPDIELDKLMVALRGTTVDEILEQYKEKLLTVSKEVKEVYEDEEDGITTMMDLFGGKDDKDDEEESTGIASLFR